MVTQSKKRVLEPTEFCVNKLKDKTWTDPFYGSIIAHRVTLASKCTITGTEHIYQTETTCCSLLCSAAHFDIRDPILAGTRTAGPHALSCLTTYQFFQGVVHVCETLSSLSLPLSKPPEI